MIFANDVLPGSAQEWVNRFWAEHRVSRGERVSAPPQLAAMPAGGSVEARALQGRWCVVCPRCGSGQYASPADPRFYCVNCAPAGYQTVRFPADWQYLSAALDRRPDPETRNWDPAETLDDLLAENRRHGL